MFRNKKVAAVVAVLGAVTIAAHVTLGAAGIMTAAQWQSGALIGMIVLMVGVMGTAMAH